MVRKLAVMNFNTFVVVESSVLKAMIIDLGYALIKNKIQLSVFGSVWVVIILQGACLK